MNLPRRTLVLSIFLAGGCVVTRGSGDAANHRAAHREAGAGASAATGELPWDDEEGQVAPIRDPLEPVNRLVFEFNDKLYFWVLKPVATGYKKVVPQDVRTGIRNFFSNASTPVRLANCLLQAKFDGAWTELSRFAINTTVGVAGFGDPAAKRFNLKKRDEDLGQTLGVYGLGPGIYITWPILGPSSIRDTVGFAGDAFLDPAAYLVPSLPVRAGVKTLERINDTSLRLGDYENFKKAAIDPYISVRNTYHEHREQQIRN